MPNLPCEPVRQIFRQFQMRIMSRLTVGKVSPPRFVSRHSVPVLRFQLRSPIIYNASQRPIRLASSPPQSGIRCLLSGWGRTSATGRASQMLLKINTGLIDNGSCMNSLGIQIYSTQVCAFSRRGIGACQVSIEPKKLKGYQRASIFSVCAILPG